ncbi:hypothetical protein [Endozoicomonas sp. 2B-B]
MSGVFGEPKNKNRKNRETKTRKINIEKQRKTAEKQSEKNRTSTKEKEKNRTSTKMKKIGHPLKGKK